ncbi:MAG TPA: helix-turn-helix domain-containing protein [Fimbriimonadaceae bacterium]|nr:helix-turn-helix domain-containing protein [Fimbriimonadaceae bacterium]
MNAKTSQIIRKPQKVSREIKIRWTPELVEEGFTPISTFFLDHYAQVGLTAQEFTLVAHLMRFKWDERHPFPSFEILATRTGCSYSAVRGHARSLENKGLLRRVRRKDRVEFDLHPLFEKLEELRRELKAA